MSKNSQNKLKFILAGVILLLVLFTIVALAVPFENKFDTKYWVAFSFAFLDVIAVIFGMGIVINADDYNNDSAANKISLIGCASTIVGFVASIIFMVVTIEQIWVPVVILAASKANFSCVPLSIDT